MRRTAAPIVIASLVMLLAACGEAVSDEYEVEEQPYTLRSVDGEELPHVMLTEDAADKIGLETAQVEKRGSTLVVPNDAVYIDSHGDFWVFSNPEPLEFVRTPIQIVRESSTEAFLSYGPRVGTAVVTVGVPELYGAETEFGTD
jgi:hypothetical protein